jgi:inner membrane transporter RhtA
MVKARSVPAPVFFVTGALSMYLGAAAAVRLFDVVNPAVVVWLRQLGAAVVLLAWRHPRTVWRGVPAGGHVRVGHRRDEHRIL